MKHNTQILKDAIAEYDLGEPGRRAMWDVIQHDGHLRTCQHNDEVALVKVQQAFYEVTKHVNNWEHCRLADIPFMRRIAALDEIKDWKENA